MEINAAIIEMFPADTRLYIAVAVALIYILCLRMNHGYWNRACNKEIE